MVVKQSADKHSMSADCDVRRALSALAPENSDSPDMVCGLFLLLSPRSLPTGMRT